MPSEKRFAEIRKLLERHGWRLERIHGSHHIFSKSGQTPLVIPVHKNRVKPGYVRAIRQRLAQEKADD